MNDARALKNLRYHFELSRNALSEYTDIPEKRLESIERGESNVTPQELFTLIDFMFDRKPQGEVLNVR
jgi:hypothetical protein